MFKNLKKCNITLLKSYFLKRINILVPEVFLDGLRAWMCGYRSPWHIQRVRADGSARPQVSTRETGGGGGGEGWVCLSY